MSAIELPEEQALTPSDLARLARLEIVIEDGLTTFVKVGDALLEIRSKRLYRDGFDTFEDYCQTRWEFSRQRASQLIQASEVSNMLDSPPKNARQAAELLPLLANPDALRDVWAEASADGQPTALKVREAVQAHVGHNSGENEWYTPLEYIDAAIEVLGAIDLDPASNEDANRIVRATKFFTIGDNGLKQDWLGRVWLNPPYAQPYIAFFCEKLVAEYSTGAVSAAIVLVNNATETVWFQRLASVSAAICFPAARIRFWHPNRKSASPLQGQAVLYLGPNPDRFRATYMDFGFTVQQ